MNKKEIIETIFKTQIDCDKQLNWAEDKFGSDAPHTIGLRYASVQSREIISKLNLDEAFYQYKEENIGE